MKPKSYRKEKLPELLQHLAAEWLERESNRTSLITVTGSRISDSQKHVTILFTVLPENQEAAALDFVKRRMRDFIEYIEKHSRIGRMPEIEFMIDGGEKNRQRIDFLLESE